MPINFASESLGQIVNTMGAVEASLIQQMNIYNTITRGANCLEIIAPKRQSFEVEFMYMDQHACLYYKAYDSIVSFWMDHSIRWCGNDDKPRITSNWWRENTEINGRPALLIKTKHLLIDSQGKGKSRFYHKSQDGSYIYHRSQLKHEDEIEEAFILLY